MYCNASRGEQYTHESFETDLQKFHDIATVNELRAVTSQKAACLR